MLLCIDVTHKNKLFSQDSYRWYHGRLDRFTAEERLWDANKMGSYLVRESDRKPGNYVLSYLGRTGINHFRITAVCGDYYIGNYLSFYNCKFLFHLQHSKFYLY